MFVSYNLIEEFNEIIKHKQFYQSVLYIFKYEQ